MNFAPSRFVRSLRRPAAVALLVASTICGAPPDSWIAESRVARSWGVEANAEDGANKAAVLDSAAAAVEARLAEDVRYLASDELEGRGVGTAGLDKAADHLAARFASLGLKTDLFDGGPFQKFEMVVAVEQGPKEQNRLEFVGPKPADGGAEPKFPLTLGENVQTLGIGGSNAFSAPVAFVGYGITAPNLKYDDYAGIDVKDKVVVILRKEPQQNNPHSVFDGTRPSQHAPFTRKIANAFEHGAAAVVLVNDHYELRTKRASDEREWREAVDKLADLRKKFLEKKDATAEDEAKHRDEVRPLVDALQAIQARLSGDYDQLLEFNGAGSESGHPKLPVYFAKRAAVDAVFKAAGADSLETLERKIDENLEPASRLLTGWNAAGEANVVRKKATVKNVVAVLEGEGPLADETVVVGAHYDHVGRGGPGSGSLAVAPWTADVHNGADDNGSGTAALLEVARRYAAMGVKPKRRIVFIAFTAEERGLIGSAKYVREPRFALESTVAMVNMDMVGRLKDDKLIVYGTGTATEFDPLVESLNKKYQFKLTKHPEGFGPSDHASFYSKQIPVFHFFTGTHEDYHRPSDDTEKINFAGIRRITDMVCDVVDSIAQAEKRPEYKEVKVAQPNRGGGDRPYFGSIPDFAQEGEGYALMGVTKGGPADQAGLKPGDVIVKVGESRIGNLEDFDSALRKFKAGDKVPVVAKRGKDEVTVTVTLGAPR